MNSHADITTMLAGAKTTQRNYTTKALTSFSDFEALEPAWKALEAEAKGAILFQSYNWCRLAASHMIEQGSARLYICAVYKQDVLVGLLPLTLWKKGVRTVLTALGEPFVQYTEMLVADGHDAEVIFKCILPALKKSGADYVHFGKVRQSGALHKGCGDLIPKSDECAAAPYVPMSDWPDYDTYFKTIKSKTRKNMRNARNRLLKEGDIVHETASNGALLDSVISRTYEGRTAWLERLGLTSRAFQDVGFESFLDNMREPEKSGIETMAFCLTHGGKPIAEQWGFVHKNRYYAFMSTWDTDYEESSPGKLHLGEVIKACYDHGVVEADFLVPAVAYKFTWAPAAETVSDRMLPMTFIGWVYAKIWLCKVRPLAKKTAYALPHNIRKQLIGWVLRNKNN